MRRIQSITTLSCVFLLIFAGCPPLIPLTDEALEAAYQAAIADAAVAEPNEICRNLTAITAYNDALIWEGEPANSRVLMATWTDWAGYDEWIGQVYTTPWEFWVTAAPEVQDFCRRYRGWPVDLTLRLEQLLGLPPHDGKDRFVEFWVDPADLYRPSADPEITDHEAGLTFPGSPNFLTVSEEYMQWYNDLMAVSYGEDGYPWTRLGYTYDWGNPRSDIGISEFIIRGGAEVTVDSVTLTEDYCACTE